MKTILVTGGAGYIGSHSVKVLLDRGFKVVILDSLITGNEEAIDPRTAFYKGDIADPELLSEIVHTEKIDAVIHFAARSLVGESVEKPDLYFHENTAKTNSFASNLIKLGVNKIIFSSTAAVYGVPEQVPIVEETETNPINPYGFSKLMIEESFKWLEKAYGLKWMALRYFNAAGAVLDGSIGEDHTPESHLIPLILKTALGKREAISIYGTDYNTPDGTCIRDYVHVLDLAEAHILALEALEKGHSSGILNVGTGHGYSVHEVIDAAKGITGVDFPVVEGFRRAGDPDVLVAEASKIRQELGWEPRYSDLHTIIESAWRWHKQHPEEYLAGRS